AFRPVPNGELAHTERDSRLAPPVKSLVAPRCPGLLLGTLAPRCGQGLCEATQRPVAFLCGVPTNGPTILCPPVNPCPPVYPLVACVSLSERCRKGWGAWCADQWHG